MVSMCQRLLGANLKVKKKYGNHHPYMESVLLTQIYFIYIFMEKTELRVVHMEQQSCEVG